VAQMTARAEESLLKEIRDRFTYGTDEWEKIRAEGRKDMRFIAGDPWDPKDRKKREAAGRPCLALDELNQYVNQLINDLRANPRAIKVTPMGAGATDQTANLRANLIRQIEYRSNAQQGAYTTMGENAFQRSYGFLVVRAKYVNARSFDQELLIEPLVNPDLVTIDPDHQKPDGADMKWGFIHEMRAIEDFKREFPGAKVRSFNADHRATAPAWIKPKKVQLAEYWKVEARRRKLLLVQLAAGPGAPAAPPEALFEDEVKARYGKGASFEILKEREADDQSVTQYFTNGIEILKATPWPGRSIPIVCCYGKVLYVDFGGGTEKRLASMIRLARDPEMLYCYYRTTEAELVGMTPRVPAVGYTGQFTGHENDWKRAAHEPLAFLEANPTTEATGQQILPLPIRMPYDPPIQSLEIGAESARRAIQAAIGSTPLPTSAQRQNEKSGIALQRIEDTAQKGSFHFVDHYEASITRTGVIIDENLAAFYDTARDVAVRKPDNETEIARINDATATDAQGNAKPFLRTDIGDHDLTISVGPRADSEREAASDFAAQLLPTPAAPMVMDLIVKLRNLGPIGDEIAERLTPPQFRRPKDGAPDPQQLQAQLGQLQEQLQACEAALSEAQQELQTKRLENESRERIAKASDETKVKIAEVQFGAATTVAAIKADTERALETVRQQVLQIQALVEGHQAALDRQHEAGMAAAGAAAAAEAGDREHQQAREMAELGQAHNLETIAATPAPAPAEGEQ
jgi:hypothetical protein